MSLIPTRGNGEPEPLLLTIPQIAKALQISRGTAYNLVSTGQLPSIRIGRAKRVPRQELLQWIERQRQKAKG